jgi:RecB family endonuclease NucS
MFINKFNHFLTYNKLVSDKPEDPERFERIKFNEFRLADIESRRRDKVEKLSVRLESNYLITKILGSGATSFVFEGYQSN